MAGMNSCKRSAETRKAKRVQRARVRRVEQLWLRVGQLAKMLSARNRGTENGSNWLDWKDARIDLEKGKRKYATHRA